MAREQLEEVKSIASTIERDVQQLLAHCFPQILVNILPYFAYQNDEDSESAGKRETACKVYDVLKDENCLGKQVPFLSLLTCEKVPNWGKSNHSTPALLTLQGASVPTCPPQAHTALHNLSACFPFAHSLEDAAERRDNSP